MAEVRPYGIPRGICDAVIAIGSLVVLSVFTKDILNSTNSLGMNSSSPHNYSSTPVTDSIVKAIAPRAVQAVDTSRPSYIMVTANGTSTSSKQESRVISFFKTILRGTLYVVYIWLWVCLGMFIGVSHCIKNRAYIRFMLESGSEGEHGETGNHQESMRQRLTSLLMELMIKFSQMVEVPRSPEECPICSSPPRNTQAETIDDASRAAPVPGTGVPALPRSDSLNSLPPWLYTLPEDNHQNSTATVHDQHSRYTDARSSRLPHVHRPATSPPPAYHTISSAALQAFSDDTVASTSPAFAYDRLSAVNSPQPHLHPNATTPSTAYGVFYWRNSCPEIETRLSADRSRGSSGTWSTLSYNTATSSSAEISDSGRMNSDGDSMHLGAGYRTTSPP